VFYSGHVKAAKNLRRALSLGGNLESWKAGSFRKKYKFHGHHQLIVNANKKENDNLFPFVLQRETKTSYLQMFSGQTRSEVSQTLV
jgi:hypothetical protein